MFPVIWAPRGTFAANVYWGTPDWGGGTGGRSEEYGAEGLESARAA